MIDFSNWLFKSLAPLSKRKEPQIAAVLGFLFGGIGLGIYFLSFIDFLIPILIVILMSILFSGVGNLDFFTSFILGSIIAALYGYLRVLDSNSKLS